MEWKSLSRDKALDMISSALNCRFSGEGLRVSVVSECLRNVLYQYSISETEETRQTVTSLRLTNAVRRKLAPLWSDIADIDDAIHPGIMSILDSLAELGDMFKLEGGNWLTVAPHAVRTDHNMAILLGGDPACAFSTDVVVKSVGRVRLIEQGFCTGSIELWDANEWIGAPVEGNEKWSTKLLSKTVSGFIDAPSDMKEAIAYVKGKWVHLPDLPIHEKRIYLCRMPIDTSFSYFLGEVEAGDLCRMNSLESSDDARRLRFFLDTKDNCPLKVRIKMSDGLARLRLTRRLPRQESKVLLLGWREAGPEGEHSGITRHVFPEEILPIVRSAFEGLGIIWINEPT
ncbi:TPA: Druantia anti-phage system protein DruD [Klebsiella aerogenes]